MGNDDDSVKTFGNNENENINKMTFADDII